MVLMRGVRILEPRCERAGCADSERLAGRNGTKTMRLSDYINRVRIAGVQRLSTGNFPETLRFLGGKWVYYR